MKIQLYLKKNNELKELEHSTEYCKRLNISLNSINQKRKRKTLVSPHIYIKGGYYFINEQGTEPTIQENTK